MEKDEFVKCCKQSGYCSEQIAKEYAKNKKDFSEKDFEEVYRIDERRSFWQYIDELLHHAHNYVEHGKTTRSFDNDDWLIEKKKI